MELYIILRLFHVHQSNLIYKTSKNLYTIKDSDNDHNCDKP